MILTQVAGYQILGKNQPSIHAHAYDLLTVALRATATLTQPNTQILNYLKVLKSTHSRKACRMVNAKINASSLSKNPSYVQA
jgi:hypothetical protein